jgi:hypothetical protein
MTTFEKTQLKTLLWKEWRQLAPVVYMSGLVIGICVAIPFFVSEAKRGDTLSFGSMFASLLACFGTGVVSYGIEFSDRTNRYLATRPVLFRQVFFVKIALGLLVVWSFAFIAWAAVVLFNTGPIITYLFRPTSPFNHWWAYGPLVFAAVQFIILLVDPMVPSLILAIAGGLLALFFCPAFSPLSLIGICLVLLGGSYYLARWRMRGEGW